MTTRDYPRILVSPPGPKGKAVVAQDEQWTSTSYIKEYPLVIAGGKGAMLEDIDGNRYIDFMAGIAVIVDGVQPSQGGPGHQGCRRPVPAYLRDGFLLRGLLQPRGAAGEGGTRQEQEAGLPLQLGDRGGRRSHQARPKSHSAFRSHRLSSVVPRPQLRGDEPYLEQGEATRPFRADAPRGLSRSLRQSLPGGQRCRRRWTCRSARSKTCSLGKFIPKTSRRSSSSRSRAKAAT